MNKAKIFSAAAGLALAAGITTAGTIYIDGQQVGTYTGDVVLKGNGRIDFPAGTTISGNDGGGNQTGVTAVIDGPSSCSVGQACSYSGSNSTGSNLTYSWSKTGTTSAVSGASSANYSVTWSGAGSFSVTLTVSDGTNSDTATLPVSVTDGNTGGGGGDTPAACDGVGLAGSWGLDTSPASFPTFPPATGSANEFTLTNNEYNAIQFTATAGYTGFVNFDKHNNAANAEKTIAISRCPGDFSQELPNSACRRQSNIPSMYIDVGVSPSLWECSLEPGQTYYLNIVHGTGTGNNLSQTCTKGICGGLYTFY